MALIKRKAAHHEFEIVEEFEAGIELAGHETKALRSGMGSLEGAHIIIRGGEAFLVGMHVPAYQPANAPADYDPDRPRRLLLHKKEIGKLAGYERQKGLTIVPISVYNKNRNLKVLIAVAKGRKKEDKRRVIKEREEKRRMDREIKRGLAE